MNVLRRLAQRLTALPPPMVAGLLAVVAALLAMRLLGLTWLLAVNVPFSDQWALLTRLYNGFQWSDAAAAFIWQHGPHRQGLNFSLVLPAYHFSDWNVRWDSLWTACVQLVAGLLALRLRRRLLPAPWSVWDAVLLLAFWGVGTFETVLVAPNASHSVFPLLLLMGLLNVWLAAPGFLNHLALVALVVSLGFTGFGLTALPALMLVALIDVWRGSGTQCQRAMVVLAAGVLTLLAFLHRYQFVVAADGFQVLRPDPTDYLRFMAAMLSHFLLMLQRSSPWVLYPAGALLLAAWVGACLWGVRRLSRPARVPDSDRALWQVCVVLAGCSLVFALLTAYGRAQLGVGSAMASRYTALLLPGLLAVYLLLFRHRERWSVLLLAMVVLFAARLLPETREAWLLGRYYAGMKLCWLEQHQATGSVAQADARLQALDVRGQFQPGWLGRQAQWDLMARERLGPLSPSAAAEPLLQVYPQPCELLR
jgi:hypothetical protein